MESPLTNWSIVKLKNHFGIFLHYEPYAVVQSILKLV